MKYFYVLTIFVNIPELKILPDNLSFAVGYKMNTTIFKTFYNSLNFPAANNETDWTTFGYTWNFEYQNFQIF